MTHVSTVYKDPSSSQLNPTHLLCFAMDSMHLLGSVIKYWTPICFPLHWNQESLNQPCQTVVFLYLSSSRKVIL